MKYKIINSKVCDTHIFIFKSFVIEIYFYRFKYWTFIFKINTEYKDDIIIYLPTLDISINQGIQLINNLI